MFKHNSKKLLIGTLFFGLFAGFVNGAEIKSLNQEIEKSISEQSISIRLDSGNIYDLTSDLQINGKELTVSGEDVLIRVAGTFKITNSNVLFSGVSFVGMNGQKYGIESLGKNKIIINKSKVLGLESLINISGDEDEISISKLLLNQDVKSLILLSGGKVKSIGIVGSTLNSLLLKVGKGELAKLTIKMSSATSKPSVIDFESNTAGSISKILVDKSIIKSDNFITRMGSKSDIKFINTKLTYTNSLIFAGGQDSLVMFLSSIIDGNGGELLGNLSFSKSAVNNIKKIFGVKSMKSTIVLDSNISILDSGEILNSLIMNFSSNSSISGKGKLTHSQLINSNIDSNIIVTKILSSVFNQSTTKTEKIDGKNVTAFGGKFQTDLSKIVNNKAMLESILMQPKSVQLTDTDYGIKESLLFQDKSKSIKLNFSKIDEMIKQAKQKPIQINNTPKKESNKVEQSTGTQNSIIEETNGQAHGASQENPNGEVKVIVPKNVNVNTNPVQIVQNNFLNNTYFGVQGKIFLYIMVAIILFFAVFMLQHSGKKHKIATVSDLELNDLDDLKNSLSKPVNMKKDNPSSESNNKLDDTIMLATASDIDSTTSSISTGDSKVSVLSDQTGNDDPKLVLGDISVMLNNVSGQEESKIDNFNDSSDEKNEQTSESFSLDIGNGVEENVQLQQNTESFSLNEPAEKVMSQSSEEDFELSIEITPIQDELIEEKLDLSNMAQEVAVSQNLEGEQLELGEIQVLEIKEEGEQLELGEIQVSEIKEEGEQLELGEIQVSEIKEEGEQLELGEIQVSEMKEEGEQLELGEIQVSEMKEEGEQLELGEIQVSEMKEEGEQLELGAIQVSEMKEEGEQFLTEIENSNMDLDINMGEINVEDINIQSNSIVNNDVLVGSIDDIDLPLGDISMEFDTNTDNSIFGNRDDMTDVLSKNSFEIDETTVALVNNQQDTVSDENISALDNNELLDQDLHQPIKIDTTIDNPIDGTFDQEIASNDDKSSESENVVLSESKEENNIVSNKTIGVENIDEQDDFLKVEIVDIPVNSDVIDDSKQSDENEVTEDNLVQQANQIVSDENEIINDNQVLPQEDQTTEQVNLFVGLGDDLEKALDEESKK